MQYGLSGSSWNVVTYLRSAALSLYLICESDAHHSELTARIRNILLEITFSIRSVIWFYLTSGTILNFLIGGQTPSSIEVSSPIGVRFFVIGPRFSTKTDILNWLKIPRSLLPYYLKFFTPIIYFKNDTFVEKYAMLETVLALS